MATVSKWTPFGVALDITATGATVTRTSATKYTVKINVSWETYYSGAKTNYGMSASSGGTTYTISAFDGTKRSSGSGSFTGTYSISGNSSATKTITVTFNNFNTDNGDSATKTVSFSVTIPAWTSYKVTYNANGGSGAPGTQTKWKDQSLTLSSTRPTRTGYTFKGWAKSSTGSAVYQPGATYTANAAVTLYAVWQKISYNVSYNANGGSGAPSYQKKYYGESLTLSTTKPVRSYYDFVGWGTSASDTTVDYAPGATYTANAAVTLYAIWKSTYKKPSIKNLSVKRCTADGEISDDGTYAIISFNWETTATGVETLISIDDGNIYLSTIHGAAETSGYINEIRGDGGLYLDKTYKVTIRVTDSEGYTEITRTLPSKVYSIDILPDGKGISFGKAAEIFQDSNGNIVPTFDVKWLSRLRNHLCIGEKTGHLDGQTGIFLSHEGYIHLQRSTENNYNPYIAFLRDDETAVTTQIQLDVDTNKLKLLGADGYEIGGSTNVNGHFMIGNKTGYTDGNTGVYVNKDGYMHIQRDNGNAYIAFLLSTATSLSDGAAISLQADDNLLHFQYTNACFDFLTYFKNSIRLGYGTDGTTTTYIGTQWADNAHHFLVEKSADGLTSAFGWAGSSSYATVTKIRGRTCQYQNSSGTTALSDERLKKDFTALDKWSAFFDALEPCAFKMKAGTSGRYHLGFKAQQVEKALTDSGLTTQDFAGFIKMPYSVDEDDTERTAAYEEAGIQNGDDEYGLIYTEFTALNTFKIQQLQKENEDLKKKVDDLESRLAKLEAALNI